MASCLSTPRPRDPDLQVDSGEWHTQLSRASVGSEAGGPGGRSTEASTQTRTQLRAAPLPPVSCAGSAAGGHGARCPLRASLDSCGRGVFEEVSSHRSREGRGFPHMGARLLDPTSWHVDAHVPTDTTHHSSHITNGPGSPRRACRGLDLEPGPTGRLLPPTPDGSSSPQLHVAVAPGQEPSRDVEKTCCFLSASVLVQTGSSGHQAWLVPPALQLARSPARTRAEVCRCSVSAASLRPEQPSRTHGAALTVPLTGRSAEASSLVALALG